MSRYMGNNNKKFRIVVCSLLTLLIITVTYSEDLIKPPKSGSEDTSSKEEKGILSTLVLLYTKTRNGVRYAYDEIQYWKNMHKTYKKMEEWFSRNKEKINQIAVQAKLMTTSKEDIFARLQHAEKLCDQIEDVAIYEIREFDRTLATFEKDYDKLAAHAQKSGRMVPMTNDVINIVKGMFISESLKISDEKLNKMSFEKQEIVLAELHEHNKTAGKIDDRIPETSISSISKFVAASAMAKSEVYYGWSVGAIDNVDAIGEKFKNHKSINQTEMKTAWYGIEQMNANTFRIRHSIEELKTYIGLAGLETWKESEKRGNDLQAQLLLHDYEKAIIVKKTR